jgi:hypothetical protein
MMVNPNIRLTPFEIVKKGHRGNKKKRRSYRVRMLTCITTTNLARHLYRQASGTISKYGVRADLSKSSHRIFHECSTALPTYRLCRAVLEVRSISFDHFFTTPTYFIFFHFSRSHRPRCHYRLSFLLFFDRNKKLIRQ